MHEPRDPRPLMIAIALMILIVLGLGGCSTPRQIEEKPPIRLRLDCPDPDTRQKLGLGDTIRDAFRSREYAIDGWIRCRAAVETLQAREADE